MINGKQRRTKLHMAQTTHASPMEESRGSRLSARHNTVSDRRRDKPQLSCSLCRRRKLKCNRQHPCSNCISREEGCIYQKSSRPQGNPHPGGDSRILDDFAARSVRELVDAEFQSPALWSACRVRQTNEGCNTDDITIQPPEEGSIRLSPEESQYVGGGHWSSILEGIDPAQGPASELQAQEHQSFDAISHDVADDGSDHVLAVISDLPVNARPISGHVLLLYGCPRPSSLQEILAALPSKRTTDRCLARYFQLQEHLAVTVHAPSFRKQYEDFWQAPETVSVIWLGLLFGMIGVSTIAAERTNHAATAKPTRYSQRVEAYREKVAQCLIAGEYTKSGAFVVEAMIHYGHIEMTIASDADRSISTLSALLVNQAMRLGHHRDPCHFKRLTPFQGEMRRRVWAFVLLTDVLVSSQMGLPRMISESKYDTQEPRNLNDAELDPSASELPATRPEIEYTTMLSTIARRRMTIALGAVHDLTHSIIPYDYDQVMQVDAVLQQARASIPEIMTWRPIEANITDSPQLTFARLHGRQMYYQGVIILHRRFAFLEPESAAPSSAPTFAYSRTACIDAALEILHMQCILDEETSNDGQLFAMRWRVSSLMTHQFLTAAMILCACLTRRLEVIRHSEIVAALAKAHGIWERSGPASHEAKKAARAIKHVLGTVSDHFNAGPGNDVPGGISDQGEASFDALNECVDFWNVPFGVQDGFLEHESASGSLSF